MPSALDDLKAFLAGLDTDKAVVLDPAKMPPPPGPVVGKQLLTNATAGSPVSGGHVLVGWHLDPASNVYVPDSTNGVYVVAVPNGTSPSATFTIQDSYHPVVGYGTANDANATRTAITAATRWLVAGTGPFVKVLPAITAGNWDVYVVPVHIPGWPTGLLPAAVTLGAGLANPATPLSGSAELVFNGTTWDPLRSAFTQTVTGITTSTAQTAVNLTQTPCAQFTLNVIVTVNGATAYTVALEGSLDNAAWFTLATVAATAPANQGASVTGKPQLYVRANVTTAGAGNTLTTQLLGVR